MDIKSENNPLVSVRLMTFNHAQFIKSAMDGIMFQRTNFNIEVVVGDDFSKDNTLEIIRTYSNSDKISINILERKIGDDYWQNRQKHGRLYNFYNILQNCSGKYIAFLDGDDYWTDPYKLQKQVDSMEANEDYGLSYTNATVFDQEKGSIKGTFNFLNNAAPSSGNFFPTIVLKNYIQTLSVLVKKEYVQLALKTIGSRWYEFKMGDYPLWIEVSRITKIKYINEITAVYRKLPNSVSFHSNIEKRYNFLKYVFDIQFYFCEKYRLGDICEKLQISYARYLCLKAFDLNAGVVDKSVIKSFKPLTIRDKFIKFSLNHKWAYNTIKVFFQTISKIKNI
ncbi:glycosyltransferase [Draconibacterium sp. IB214405]|uniref:glycosyltransferase n=1 Tax=Draconibacterium sp. IB214405 TaxID=3097352 RepID=UPI002A1459B7|nr:glycosyltransferase [Draconibacterium sp. IB214405]MDX8339299.1 glycosyltransferase [Draconibacterium sp. IB214405]